MNSLSMLLSLLVQFLGLVSTTYSHYWVIIAYAVAATVVTAVYVLTVLFWGYGILILVPQALAAVTSFLQKIGRASCRERV